MTKLKNPAVWGWGLLAAIVGGAATAGTSWLGMVSAKAVGIDVPILNLKALGVICLSGGITSALSYLKQSPVPQIVEEETTIITKD